jgi:hypothetical protein
MVSHFRVAQAHFSARSCLERVPLADHRPTVTNRSYCRYDPAHPRPNRCGEWTDVGPRTTPYHRGRHRSRGTGEGAATDERFEKNWTWFTAQAEELYGTHRGKSLCISEQELFVGETPAEAIAQAKAVHPDDDGRFTRIIPQEKVERIYAHSKAVVPL